MITLLETISRKTSLALAALSGACLTLMMLLACANMVLRGAGGPLQGTFELMGYLGALTAAFSLGYAQLERSHIAVGLLMHYFPRPVRRALDALTSLASAVFFWLGAVETAKWAAFLRRTGELSETLGVPHYPFVYLTAFGCAAMAFVLAVDTVRSLAGRLDS